jgi:methionine-rich copper-binding protein CopC
MNGQKSLRASSPFLIFIFLFTLLNFSFSPIASAHTILIASSPAIDQKLKSLPNRITLTFADPLLKLAGKEINQVTVTDPMNMNDVKGKATVQGAVLSAELSTSMKMGGMNMNMSMDGLYKVDFRVVAQDGHVVTGTYNFYVSAAGDASIPTKSALDKQSGIYKFSSNSDFALTPKGESSASFVGKFSIDLAKNQICYSFTAKNLKDATMMHLHPLMASNKLLTVSDEVFVNLNITSLNASLPVCTNSSNAALNQIVRNPSHYAIMVHTAKFPDGAAAGQLKAN